MIRNLNRLPINRSEVTFSRTTLMLVCLFSMFSQHANSTLAAKGAKDAKAYVSPKDRISYKDLTIVLDSSLDPGIGFDSATSPLVPLAWYQTIGDSFEGTTAEDAFHFENDYTEWQLVSLRVTPCSPIVHGIAQKPDQFCWPQARLVWQPIKKRFRHTWGYRYNFGDDRAIHALYYFKPDKRAKETLNTMRTKLAKGMPDSKTASEFFNLRNHYGLMLLNESLRLRDKFFDTTKYDGFGPRPELFRRPEAFRKRLLSFLEKFTSPADLDELTSFSLPTGRQPAHIDQWTFKAFKPEANGTIKEAELFVHDRESGKKLFSYGYEQTVGTLAESDEVYRAWEGADLSLKNKIEDQVLLFPQLDLSVFSEKINDRSEFLVSNTTCASCHRFNENNFNFHNLSKMETDSVTISKRVQKDTKFDLKWIRENL